MFKRKSALNPVGLDTSFTMNCPDWRWSQPPAEPIRLKAPWIAEQNMKQKQDSMAQLNYFLNQNKKTTHTQNKNKQNDPLEIQSKLGGLRNRQEESGTINIRVTNFSHCLGHLKSVMMAASNYQRSE